MDGVYAPVSHCVSLYPNQSPAQTLKQLNCCLPLYLVAQGTKYVVCGSSGPGLRRSLMVYWLRLLGSTTLITVSNLEIAIGGSTGLQSLFGSLAVSPDPVARDQGKQ